MSQQTERWVGVASLGWDNVALRQHFYPEDVPSDWYLTYFANYAMAVIIPTEMWLAADDEQIADWVAQTQDNFWFYLQVEQVEQLQQAAEVQAAFAGQLAGVVTLSPIAGLESRSNPNLTVLQAGEAVYLADLTDMRATHRQLAAWLQQDVGEHRLIVLPNEQAHRLTEVQTLLELLGVMT